MEDAPTPKLISHYSDTKPLKSLNEYTKKENQKEFKIKLGISDNYIKIIIKEGINKFKRFTIN